MDKEEFTQLMKDKLEHTGMTKSEVQAHFDLIDNLTQFEMARLWRFLPSGHIYFDDRLPFFRCFEDRFQALGGMTPGISKRLGDKNA